MQASSRGFTLIELLVVIGVLGILTAAVLPLAEISLERDRERELRHGLWEIRDALDAYKHAVDAGSVAITAGSSGYPPSLQALVEGVPNAKAFGRRQYFLRRVPRDPFADEHVPAEQTWGLRSYLSSPEDPKAGDDVYDVHSTSNKIGLNGVALKDW